MFSTGFLRTSFIEKRNGKIGGSGQSEIDHEYENMNSVIGEIMNCEEERNTVRGKQIKILVVDDHPLVHHGLVRLINEEPDLTICAEAESTRRSLEILEKQQIDLAIVNISLDSIDSIRLAGEVRLRYPSLSVLTFSVSAYDELLYVRNVLQERSVGYVVNQNATEQIMEALRHVQSLLRSGVFGATICVEVKRSVSHDHRIN